MHMHGVSCHDEAKDRLTCPDCDKLFTSKRSLVGHKKEKHSGTPDIFPCVHCGKNFSRKTNLKAHMDSIHFGKKFHCAYCERIFTNRSCINLHVKKAHTVKSELQKKPFTIVQPLSEGEVKKERGMKINAALVSVSLIDTSSKNFSCPKCGKTFSRLFNRDRHVVSRHLTVKVKKEGKPNRKQHICSQESCGYKTQVKSRLAAHMRRRHGPPAPPKYQCAGCHKILIDHYKFKRHTAGLRPCKMLKPESTIILHI